MCLTNRKTYDDVNWMFEYEGTNPLAVVAIVYSQIARWRKFAKEHFYKGDDSGRSQLMAESIMQFMPLGSLFGIAWEHITYDGVRSFLSQIGDRHMSILFKDLEKWRETLGTVVALHESMGTGEDFSYQQYRHLMLDFMYPYAKGDQNLNHVDLGVPFQPLTGVIAAMVTSVNKALGDTERERVVGSLYSIVRHELGGAGDETLKFIVKLFLVILNRVELLEFLALAPGFLFMIRQNKRELFLNAYMGGNTTIILTAVKILDLSVEQMTPPEGEYL